MPESEIRSIENEGGPIIDQSQHLAPNHGVIEAYNNHEYIRGDIAPGSELVRETKSAPGDTPFEARAAWAGWSRIIVTLPEGGGPGAIIFNQNFHPVWRSSGAAVTRTRGGNLALHLAQPVAPGTVVVLSFRDESSILGGKISRISACVFLAAAALLLALAIVTPGSVRGRLLSGAP